MTHHVPEYDEIENLKDRLFETQNAAIDLTKQLAAEKKLYMDNEKEWQAVLEEKR